MTTTRSQAKKQQHEPDVHADLHAQPEPGSKHKPATSETSTPEPNAKRAKKDESDEDGSVPSSILEKGIIYFFFRGRVDIDEPSKVGDIARSFMLLRPLEHDADLPSGSIGDAGNARLLAVPKKVLPRTGRDRWISFVEKAGASFAQLKDEFLSSSDYVTKTAGHRHSPAATPVGEGVYAITDPGGDGASHLAYLLTMPETLGEVQREMGIQQKGSFIISTRNPQYPAPANARLPQGPEYPQDILEAFRSRRWMPTLPAHLDYVNTQVLLVGESSGVQKALEPQERDVKEGAEEPAEEMEKLQEEDAERMRGLSDSEAERIFADLEVRAKGYPKLQTSF